MTPNPVLKTRPVQQLILVANPEQQHVGAHLLAAARQLGLPTTLLDVRESQSRNLWVNRFYHRILGRRPAELNRFSNKLVNLCRELKPELLLVTGISAPHDRALREIGRMGIHRANFLTDDPWNPANGASFFWASLREYDAVWSPRQSNLEDLRRHGCRSVKYLPFGYNPELHFPELPQSVAERERFTCDVVFVGGADADRLPVARALVRAGLKVHLYGGYWDRDPELRPCWRGFVHGRDLRMAVSGATVNICLGRKANRDGHAMRSLELPAMQACLVVEDTPEHRVIFGDQENCVQYYSGIKDMVQKAKDLSMNSHCARAMGEQVHQRICVDHVHTYADRLREIQAGKPAQSK